MSNVFFIADTHFGHRKIIDFEGKARPFGTIEEHDAALIRNWNRVVTKRDVVWHLGDVAWTPDALLNCVSQLNGRIKLVLGNHDLFDTSLYHRSGIERMFGCVQWKRRVLLTHMPTHIGTMERFEWNVHGHTHSLGSPEGWTHHRCVSVEHTQLAPIPFDALGVERTRG